MSLATNMAFGARLYLRDAARQLLGVIDELAEHEVEAAGSTREEIATLERIAAWRIDGVPFGSWPQ
jgi:hypothetical protein